MNGKHDSQFEDCHGLALKLESISRRREPAPLEHCYCREHVHAPCGSSLVILRKEEEKVNSVDHQPTRAGAACLGGNESRPLSRSATADGRQWSETVDAPASTLCVRTCLGFLISTQTAPRRRGGREKPAPSTRGRSTGTDAAAQVRPPSRGEDTCVLPRDTEPFASGRRCSFRSTSEKAIDESDRETRSARGMRKSRRLEPGQFQRFRRHGNVPRPAQIPLLHAFPKEHGTFQRKAVLFFRFRFERGQFLNAFAFPRLRRETKEMKNIAPLSEISVVDQKEKENVVGETPCS